LLLGKSILGTFLLELHFQELNPPPQVDGGELYLREFSGTTTHEYLEFLSLGEFILIHIYCLLEGRPSTLSIIILGYVRVILI
jgi:hypothetical protein